MVKPIPSISLSPETENPFPKEFHQKMGASEWRGLSDVFGLSGFGVNLEVIKSGGSSGLKHWHSKSEEFVYIISGVLTLQYGSDVFEMKAGDCIGFKANEGKGHRLVNNTDLDASFIVVGSRVEGDTATYDEDDIQWMENKSGEWVATRKDGTIY